MSQNYRVSWVRSAGWTRVGASLGVSMLFLAPLLWSLGAFGAGDDAVKRALIFGFSGLWLFVSLGWLLGWAVHGFVVRLKEHDDGEEERRPGGPAGGPGHAPAPPHRPAH